MFTGRRMSVVIILLISLGATGLAGQLGMAQTTVSPAFQKSNLFEMTYLEFPFYVKLPFHSRHNDFIARFFIAPYLVINPPGDLVVSGSPLNDLIFKQGWRLGIGMEIYFTPQKSRPKPKKKITIRYF